MKKLNFLLLSLLPFSLISCTDIDGQLSSDGTSSLDSVSSLQESTPELELVDFMPLEGTTILDFGLSLGSERAVLETEEELAPLNDYFADVKFTKYEEEKSLIPNYDALNVQCFTPGITYEVIGNGDMFFRHNEEDTWYIATTKIDYKEFFELFYADFAPPHWKDW